MAVLLAAQLIETCSLHRETAKVRCKHFATVYQSDERRIVEIPGIFIAIPRRLTTFAGVIIKYSIMTKDKLISAMSHFVHLLLVNAQTAESQFSKVIAVSDAD